MSIIDDQLSFPSREYNYDICVNEVVDGQEIPVSYGSQGSYVDVKERARLMITSLTSISERNSRFGIALASTLEEVGAPLEERYGMNLPSVVDGASVNREKYQTQARYSFWYATGFTAFKGYLMTLEPSQRIIRPDHIKYRGRKMWRDFRRKYENPDDKDARNEYVENLKLQIGDIAVADAIIDSARKRKFIIPRIAK